MSELERMRAIVDRLLPVARMYVEAFDPGEMMTLVERMRLREIEDILADPDGWTPGDPIGTTRQTD